MADEVQINNVGGEGIASEVTLARLVAVTETMAKKAGIDPKDVTKKLRELSSATGDTIKVSTKNRDALKNNTKEIKNSTKALSKLASVAGSGLFSIFAAGARSGTELVKAFVRGEKTLTGFASQLPLIGDQLGILSGLFDDSFAAFQNVAMSGAAFNGSLTELRNSAAEARMSLDAFSGFISQNSFKLTSFGGTATQGAKQIVAMTNSSRATRESLLALGFTFEDINEAMLEYQYITRAGSRGNRLQQKTAEEQAIAAGEYAKHLNTLAKLSGEEAKVGQEAVARKMQDIAFQTALSKLGAEEQAKVQLVMHQAMAAGGQDAVDAVAAKFLGLPAVSESARLYTATMTSQMDTLTANLVTAQNEDVKQKDLMDIILVSNGDLMKDNAASAKEFEAIIAAAAVGVGGSAAMMAGFLNNATLDHVKYLSKAGKFDEAAALEDLKAAKAEGEKRDKALATMVEFTGALSDLQVAFQTQIVTPLMEAVGPALQEMVAAMTGAKIDTDTGKLMRDAEGNIIQGENIFKIAISSISDMINNDLKPGILNFIETFKDDPGKAIREMFSKGTAALTSMIKDFFLGAEIVAGPQTGQREGGFLDDAIVPVFKGLGTALVNAMVSGIKHMWEEKPVLTALTAGIAALFIAPGATIALAAGVTSMMGAGLKKMKDFAMPPKGPTNTNTTGAGGPLKKDGTPDKRFKANQVPKTSWFGPAAKGILRKAGLAGLLFGAYDIGSTLLDDTKTKDQKQQAVVETGGGMAGAAAGAYGGAAAGALLGSVVPVLGTAIGGALGGLIGGAAGWWAGSSAAGAANKMATSQGTGKSTDAQPPVLAGTSALTEAQVELMERVAALDFTKFNRSTGRMDISNIGYLSNIDFTAFSTGLKTFAEITGLKEQFENLAVANLIDLSDFNSGVRRLNVSKIQNLASTDLSVFATGLTTFANIIGLKEQFETLAIANTVDLSDFNKGLKRLDVSQLGYLASTDLTMFANGLKTFAEIPNLQTQFDAVNSLDTDGVLSYTSAMEKLVKALNNVNDELAKDNNGMFSAGTGTNAGDMINSVGGLNNGGGSGSEQLNTVMQQVLNELKLIKGFEEATAKNTKNIRSGNLANGGASATGN